MAIIKKVELAKLTVAEIDAKIVEIEKSMLELKGEGRLDRIAPLRKAIAKLLTAKGLKTKKN
ncbi:MAG: hypothetical protein ACP5N9_04740 [Candidatus Bilamarchaeum sp.]|jgi:ribosomal protein L29